tara:strand:+ start:44 stop:517 length:474 start_codon:yes stop_codon:yes gene_type:complete
MSYIGNEAKSANFLVDQFNGDNTTTQFSLTVAPGSQVSTLVFIDGVRQSVESYALNLNTITFDSPPQVGVKNIEVIHMSAGFTVATPSDLSVGTSKIVNRSVTSDKLANTAVSAGSYGNEGNIPIITVDQQGRVSNVQNVSVNIPEAGINPLLFTGT